MRVRVRKWGNCLAVRIPKPLLLLMPLMMVSACLPTVTVSRPDAGEDIRPIAELRETLERLTEGFRGDVGIYVRHLGTGEEVALRADEAFPTASMIKVPLLAALHDRVEAGELDLEAEMVYHDSLAYPGSDIVAGLEDGATVALDKLAFLMTSWSDNTASLWIQSLVGGGAFVNEWLDAHGFIITRVNSRTEGREADWEAYGWGQTTPREMSELMVMIRAGDVVSPAASERMYRTLASPYWQDRALSVLPATVQVAAKYGSVYRSRSETLVVNAPTGDYVLTFITRNQEDESREPDNEGYVLLRDVSRAVYEHFTPGDR